MSYREILSVKNDLSADISKETRKTGLQILRGVTLKTPVDKGRARGNWQLDSKNISAQLEVLDKSGGRTIGNAASKLNSLKQVKYPTIYIVNNLPYIEKLERGSSTQAPSGMVDTTIKQVLNGS